MKSENALEYLHSTSDEKEFLEMTDLLPLHDAITAVEIAEADRDAKAVEAHRATCPNKRCRKLLIEAGASCGPDLRCDYIDHFIQELNKE